MHQDKVIKRQLCKRFSILLPLNSFIEILISSFCEACVREWDGKSLSLVLWHSFCFALNQVFFCRVFCHIERIGPWPFDLGPWTLTLDVTFSVILVQLVYTLWRLDQYVIEFYVQVRILYTYVYVLFRKKKKQTVVVLYVYTLGIICSQSLLLFHLYFVICFSN